MFDGPRICLQQETEGGTPPDSEAVTEPQQEPAIEPQGEPQEGPQQEPQQEPQQQEPFLSVDLGGERYDLTKEETTRFLNDWYNVRMQQAFGQQQKGGEPEKSAEPKKPAEQPEISKLSKTVEELNKKIDEDRQQRLQEQQKAEGERILDQYRRSFTDDEHFGQVKKADETLHGEIVAEALKEKAFHKDRISHETALKRVMERYKKYGELVKRDFITGKVEAGRSSGPGRGSGAPPPTQEPKTGFTADDYASGKCDEEALRQLMELEANA